MTTSAFDRWRDYFQLAQVVEDLCRRPPSEQELCRRLPSEKELCRMPPSEQELCRMPPSEHKLCRRPPSEQELCRMPPSEQELCRRPPSEQELCRRPPSEKEQEQRESQPSSSSSAVCCSFCKQNGESQRIYRSHQLKDEAGGILCPILRQYTCPQCGANQEKAHTRRFCPLTQKGYVSVYGSSIRNSAGKFEKKKT